MNILFLRGFNNYFNRIVKKYSTLTDYENNSTSYVDFKNINFNPNDGVATELIVGSQLQKENNKPLAWDVEGTPDYLICYETTDGVDAIISRWFILESERTRDGQYRIALKRDVIAEHYEDILNAPCFVEKGNISTLSNPLIYNKEGIAFNQIKKEEIALKDETESGWVVGYIPKNSFAEQKTVSVDVVMGQGNANISVTSLANWSYNNYISKKLAVSDEVLPTTTLRVKHRGEYGEFDTQHDFWSDYIYYHDVSFSFNYNGATNLSQTSGSIKQYNDEAWSLRVSSSVGSSPGTSGITQAQALNLVSGVYNNSTYLGYLRNMLPDITSTEYVSTTTFANIYSLNNQILYDQSTGNYYRISVSMGTENTSISPAVSSLNSQYEALIIQQLNTNLTRTNTRLNWYAADNTNLSGNGDITISYNHEYIYLDLQQIALPCSVTIDSDRFHLEDSPYDMFCIPYSDTLKLRYGSGQSQVTFTCKKAVALALATAIGEQTGSDNVYDVQLLPYCPARHLIASSLNPSDTLVLDSGEYDLVMQNNTPVSAVIWCMASSFQVPINQKLSILNIKEPFYDLTDPIESNKYYVIQNLDIDPPENSAYISGLMTLIWTSKSTGSIIKAQDITSISYGSTTTTKAILYKPASDSQFVQLRVIRKPDYDSADYYLSIIIKSTFTNHDFGTYLKVPTIVDPDSPIELKVSNECDLFRLCSGNYSGVFEFSVAKSKGVDSFVAECTYKPFMPYIHITPVLKGLYELPDGVSYRDIDDTRGLICGGDFSLPAVSNAWANYQLQNKNYQAIFDRQIEHMDVNNQIATEQLNWQVETGMLTGGIGGAAGGAVAGSKAGPYGAIAGAAVGGLLGTTTSVIGGMKDMDWLQRQQVENKQYAIDMYGYQLGNIKALPNSLAKTSAITYNTRIWPFVEHYTCTNEEKEALKFKLKYNGMTIMKIDNLINYSTSTDFDRVYLKGQLINLEFINDDFHIADAIYAEVNKGFYVLQ